MVVPVESKIPSDAASALVAAIGHAGQAQRGREDSDSMAVGPKPFDSVVARELITAVVMWRVHVGQHQNPHQDWLVVINMSGTW